MLAARSAQRYGVRAMKHGCVGKQILAARNVAAAFLLAFLGPVCRTVPSSTLPAETRSDQLKRAYPDLRTGRFAVIADFENPAQLELFHVEGAAAAKALSLSRSGRPETGGTCLAYTVRSTTDELVLNNDKAVNWYLKRDWREYDLLLLCLEAPKAGRGARTTPLEGEIVLAAGAPGRQQTVQSPVRLEPGWNTLRLDLVELAERLPLDDVREMRIRIAGMPDAAVLRVDDIILAGNRDDLLGNSTNSSGELYVQQIGRGVNVGAGGRFELGFSGGQVVRWFSLAADPYRTRNMVSGTSLGPNLIEPVTATGRSTGVAASTRVTEINKVRTKIETDWHFEHSGIDSLTGSRHWIYTVYPTGQVYVRFLEAAPSNARQPEPLTLAFSMAFNRQDHVHFEPASSVAGGEDSSSWYASVRTAETSALLALIPADPRCRWERRDDLNPPPPQRSLWVQTAESSSHARPWVCQLLFDSSTRVANEEIRSRAEAYADPPPVQMKAGRIELNEQSVPFQNGFDPAEGCYRLAAESGKLQCVLDGRQRPFFYPAFSVRSDDGEAEAWVYVNQRIHDPTAWDSAGRLIFQLPSIIRDRVLVEVLFKRP